MTRNDPEIQAIVAAIRQLYRIVYHDALRSSRSSGLTSSQSAAMRILYQNGPLSSADLSRRLHVTPSNMTGLIDRLEKKHLVERVPDLGDRRIALITLTEKGRRLGQNLPDPIENKIVSRLGHLEEQEIQEYRIAIGRILDLIDNAEGQDAAAGEA
jgi:DNA-binding MarR family transcriptional regulator